jgi:hypothetical protein
VRSARVTVILMVGRAKPPSGDPRFRVTVILMAGRAKPRSGGILIAWGVSPRNTGITTWTSREAATHMPGSQSSSRGDATKQRQAASPSFSWGEAAKRRHIHSLGREPQEYGHNNMDKPRCGDRHNGRHHRSTEVPLVKINTILHQENRLFFLERPATMVSFLIANVIDQRRKG